MTNNAAIHATGNIKLISFFSGTLFLLCPILTYLIFRFADGPVVSGYIIDGIIITLVVLASFYIIKRQIPEMRIVPYIIAIVRSLIVIFISAVLVYIINNIVIIEPDYMQTGGFKESLLICLLVFVENAIILIPITLFLAFNKADRQVIVNKCKSKIRTLFGINE